MGNLGKGEDEREKERELLTIFSKILWIMEQFGLPIDLFYTGNMMQFMTAMKSLFSRGRC